MVANSDLVNQISILNNIEHKLKGTEILRESQGPTLKDQLKILDQKFKFTQVQLNSIVTGASQVLLVSPEQAISVEVQSMNTTLVKVDTKDHKGPLQFFIDMHKPGDLTCYAAAN